MLKSRGVITKLLTNSKMFYWAQGEAFLWDDLWWEGRKPKRQHPITRRRRRQLATRCKPGRASLLPVSLLLGFGYGRIPLRMLLFMGGRALFAGHWQKIAVLYCLKSCLVKVAPGEKIKWEAAGVQSRCWGCGHLRGGCRDGAGVGHRGPDLPASTPARHCITPLFVADIEKTN